MWQPYLVLELIKYPYHIGEKLTARLPISIFFKDPIRISRVRDSTPHKFPWRYASGLTIARMKANLFRPAGIYSAALKDKFLF